MAAVETIGARIRRLRLGCDLSAGALAAKIQTPSGRSLVHSWETDRTAPSSAWIMPLCRALGVSAEYLLTGAEAGTGAAAAGG